MFINNCKLQKNKMKNNNQILEEKVERVECKIHSMFSRFPLPDTYIKLNDGNEFSILGLFPFFRGDHLRIYYHPTIESEKYPRVLKIEKLVEEEVSVTYIFE